MHTLFLRSPNRQKAVSENIPVNKQNKTKSLKNPSINDILDSHPTYCFEDNFIYTLLSIDICAENNVIQKSTPR